MVKRSYFLIALLLIIVTMGFASAIETTIVVNTAPNFTVNAFFSEASTGAYSVIEMINQDSGPNGKAVFVLETTKSEFELKLNLRKDGETHYSVKYDEVFKTGENIELDFYPIWSPKPVPKNDTVQEANETLSEKTILNDTSEEVTNNTTTKSISGHVININGKTFAYAGGIVILAIIIFIFIRWKLKPKENQQPEIKVKKLSEMNQDKNDDIKNQELQIEETRNKLKEAEEKLQKMKNPNLSKIDEAKRKLIEDEKELMRLRREYSSR